MTSDGLPIASVWDLKEGLHRLAFPGTPDVDLHSSLGDLFEVAVARANNDVRKRSRKPTRPSEIVQLLRQPHVWQRGCPGGFSTPVLRDRCKANCRLSRAHTWRRELG